MTIDADLLARPFETARDVREARLLAGLDALTRHHRDRCPPYRALLDAMFPASAAAPSTAVADVPFVPVRLFKQMRLSSIDDADVFKVLTSSGTTGQAPSRIVLDREAATLQTRALVATARSFVGPTRLPMVIVDSPTVIRDRASYGARGAGVVGFSTLGRDHLYLLDEEMRADWDALDRFLERHAGTPVLLFGFTFLVWQRLYQQAVADGRRIDLARGILIHGGGWKRLVDEAVSSDDFKRRLRDTFGLTRVHNYYGMIEQIGSVFIECEQGALHIPAFADALVRDPLTLRPLAVGEPGALQVLSLLPRSYPGHSVLTEDVGRDLGDDPCPCGRLGRRIAVEGRFPQAELRGCSDAATARRA